MLGNPSAKKGTKAKGSASPKGSKQVSTESATQHNNARVLPKEILLTCSVFMDVSDLFSLALCCKRFTSIILGTREEMKEGRGFLIKRSIKTEVMIRNRKGEAFVSVFISPRLPNQNLKGEYMEASLPRTQYQDHLHKRFPQHFPSAGEIENLPVEQYNWQYHNVIIVFQDEIMQIREIIATHGSMKSVTNFFQGRRHGREAHWDHDILSEETTYIDGQIQEKREYWNSEFKFRLNNALNPTIKKEKLAALKMIRRYKNGRSHGIEEHYYPSGVLQRTETYVNGESYGLAEEFDQTGKKISSQMIDERFNFSNGTKAFCKCIFYIATGQDREKAFIVKNRDVKFQLAWFQDPEDQKSPGDLPVK